MKDFLLIFRMEPATRPTATPEQMEGMLKLWTDWLGGIASNGKLVTNGNRLEDTGRVLKPNNVITNGPFVEIKETIGGYSIIKAGDYDEAVEISKGCPGLLVGGSVEVRAINPM